MPPAVLVQTLQSRRGESVRAWSASIHDVHTGGGEGRGPSGKAEKVKGGYYRRLRETADKGDGQKIILPTSYVHGT